MNKLKNIAIPAGVILGSVIIAVLLINARPKAKTVPPRHAPKLVRVMEVTDKPVTMVVKSQGTVSPRTQTNLITRVAGTITKLSPAFVAGGFFDKNDVLATIDKRDYELALAQAKLQVAQAELQYQLEQNEGKIAREEWMRLNDGTAPALVARKPQLAQVKASLDAAKAALNQAKLNIERTQVKAPYAGRIRTKTADIGQYVSPGMNLATLYAVDYAEVRLPLPNHELEYLNIPFSFRGAQNFKNGPKVMLSAKFGGKKQTWEGFLTRIEGEIDSRSRMIYVVARVNDPYGNNHPNADSPLAVGMFVNAEITGKMFSNIIEIPRSVIRSGNTVLVVDENQTLHIRPVGILRLGTETAYIKSGLSHGERIVTSVINAVTDGMKVAIYNDEN